MFMFMFMESLQLLTWWCGCVLQEIQMKRTAIEAFNETMLIFEKQCREQERFGEEFERNNQSDGVDKDLER